MDFFTTPPPPYTTYDAQYCTEDGYAHVQPVNLEIKIDVDAFD